MLSKPSPLAPKALQGPDRQLPYSLRALQHRNFRLFFVGQFVSRTGFWMQNMAQGWLVYQLTQSSFMLGLVAFAGQFPTLLLGLLAGVIAALGAEAVGAILQTQVFELDYRPYPWLWLAGVSLGTVGITALGLVAGRRALHASPLRALSA